MTTKIVIKPSDAAREMTTMSNELQLMLASLTSLRACLKMRDGYLQKR